jgi:hypothetical protein
MRRGTDNIKDVGIVYVDCIHLTQNRNYWRSLAIVLLDLRIL